MAAPEHRTHRNFVILWPLVLLCTLLGYAWGFRTYLVKEAPVVPASYKDWLLRELPGPRILIDSGSNAFHSINGELMESLTGYPVVLLSDHAGASFHDKCERLIRFTHSGDLCILPLEWSYYVQDDLSNLHLQSSLSEGSHYLHALPLGKQLQRAFQTPWMTSFSRLLDGHWHERDRYADELQRLTFFHDHHWAKDPSGGATDLENLKNPSLAGDCDAYILSPLLKQERALSPDFRHNLRHLATALRKKGVKLILIPPAVAGDNCYLGHSERLEKTLNAAIRFCQSIGVPILSDYRRHAYPTESFLNTHYHIDPKARDHHTPLLVQDLLENGFLSPRESAAPPLKAQVPALLEASRLKLLAAKMPRWKGNPTEITAGNDQGIFFFGKDWYAEDPMGRWAIGTTAEVNFCPDPKHDYEAIYVNARYYAGTQRTRILLNGELIAEQDLEENHLIRLPRPLSTYLKTTPVVTLSFISSDLISPQQHEASNDHRPLKFGLHSLELKRKPHP
jgi:hypothetical protein